VSTVHVVVPDGIDDPTQPSGGNAYDRRVCGGLEALGWRVVEHAVAGSWPEPDARACAGLARVVAGLDDGGVVLLDGLVATSAPDVLVPHAARLRLVVLVHLPLGTEGVGGGDGIGGGVTSVRWRERAVLCAATRVVTTSWWTRDWLLSTYGLQPDRVRVAHPGADRGVISSGTTTGGEFLCVATVAEHKGHDVLLEALADLADVQWRCTLAGSLTRDPVLASRLRDRAGEAGISGRLRFAGPLVPRRLEGAYAAADVVLVPSRTETYGMVVGEALAHGLPVIASDVGGVPEALRGPGAPGSVPEALAGLGDDTEAGRLVTLCDDTEAGLLVPPGDPAALAEALRRWLGGSSLRERLRRGAARRRDTLPSWVDTSARVSRALSEAAA
jgi:glycosyltransferase involved in cell wall biosynthesis